MRRWLSVAEAAAELQVSDRQVRHLIGSGHLDAEQAGRVWLVSTESVRARLRVGTLPGRPLSAVTSWRLLARVDAVLRGNPEEVDGPDDRRVRHRLRELQLGMPSIEQWAHWMRRRGELRWVWFHPGVVHRVVADARSARPDPSAALGLQVADLVPIYVDRAELDGLVAEFRGSPATVDEQGAIRVMGVPELPDDLTWQLHVETAALVDLVGHPDPRVSHAAISRLQNAADVLHLAHQPSVDPGPESAS